MNPKQFLLAGGVVLVAVAVAGFLGIIGPTAEKSPFGPAWWFDNAENWAHLVFGVVALVAAFALGANLQGLLTLLVGVISLLVGLWSAVLGQNLLGANLENPADTVLHVLVGVWALWAWWNSKKAVSTAPVGGAM